MQVRRCPPRPRTGPARTTRRTRAAATRPNSTRASTVRSAAQRVRGRQRDLNWSVPYWRAVARSAPRPGEGGVDVARKRPTSSTDRTLPCHVPRGGRPSGATRRTPSRRRRRAQPGRPGPREKRPQPRPRTPAVRRAVLLVEVGRRPGDGVVHDGQHLRIDPQAQVADDAEGGVVPRRSRRRTRSTTAMRPCRPRRTPRAGRGERPGTRHPPCRRRCRRPAGRRGPRARHRPPRDPRPRI